MSNPLKKLLGETAIYGLSSIVGRALNYLLVPFYTTVFIESEYGVISELYAYVAFFNILYLMGLETAYFRFSTKNKSDEQNIFNQSQTLVLGFGVLISAAIIGFSGVISESLKLENYRNEIIYLAIIMFVDAAVALPFAKLRLQNKAAKYAALKLSNIGLNIFLNLFFLIFCKDISEGKYLTNLQNSVGMLYNPEVGVGYVFIANLIANGLYLPMLYKELGNYKISFSTQKIKPILYYSLPIMIMGFAGIINETTDRIFLKFLTPKDFYPGFDNQAVVGIYSACYKLSIFMTLGIQAFRYAAEPFFFSNAEQKNSREMFSKIMTWFIYIGCGIFLAISLNLDWIAQILLRQEGYRSGLAVVPILLVANLFLGIYYNLSVWFKLTDKTYWGSYISIIGALITILGNVFLIPVLGYMGSAYTTLFCYILMGLISHIVGQKYYPIPYKNGLNLTMILTSVAIYLMADFAYSLLLLPLFLIIFLISIRQLKF